MGFWALIHLGIESAFLPIAVLSAAAFNPNCIPQFWGHLNRTRELWLAPGEAELNCSVYKQGTSVFTAPKVNPMHSQQ